MKKATTTYYEHLKCRENTVYITVDEGNRISLHDYGEPCSGVLRHWGTREELKKELQELIKIIDEIP